MNKRNKRFTNLAGWDGCVGTLCVKQNGRKTGRKEGRKGGRKEGRKREGRQESKEN